MDGRRESDVHTYIKLWPCSTLYSGKFGLEFNLSLWEVLMNISTNHSCLYTKHWLTINFRPSLLADSPNSNTVIFYQNITK